MPCSHSSPNRAYPPSRRWWPRLSLLLTGLSILLGRAGATETFMVPRGSTWSYLADGSDQGTNWRLAAFDDSTWNRGRAPLGFGEAELATVMTPAPGPVTAYFRHVFTVANWRDFTTLTIRMRRDDGLIVYLNNRLLARQNMPAGQVGYLTPALAVIEGNDEERFIQFGTAPHLLANGTNVLAVELHQAAGAESDGVFDLELLGNLPLGPPAVGFLSPTNGQVLVPDVIPLSVTASDEDGHVGVVEFYVNDGLVGTDSTEPFGLNWFPDPGRYALRAEAIDYSGRRGISSPVHVQVGENIPDRVVRGPYLQQGTPTSVIVRWRTDWFTSSRVWYGPGPGDLDFAVGSPELTTEHEVRLTGLHPDTRYYYAVGTEERVLSGGADHHFTTVPTNSRPVRIWVIGDAGTADDAQAAVRDAFAWHVDGAPVDLWLMLGDNAYECGTDDQYQRGVFDMYPALLRRLVVWPTIGNHDAGCFPAGGGFPYLDIFSLPSQGEAGGVPSGTERYYSFDYANIHFICLDSSSSSRLRDGPMVAWLEQDLAATAREWIVAFWHHPPYSFGTHNTDWEQDLIEMREHVVPVLERHGVDLVLCGHSHNYERSYLINGHHGYSWEFNDSHLLDAGFGRDDEDGAYRKPAGGLGANRGAVFAVCGCSGQGGYFEPQYHPAMRVSLTGFGSMILEFDGLRLDARFISESGAVRDYFTLKKGLPDAGTRPRLQISRSAGGATVSWPTSLWPFQLEAAGRLQPDPLWAPVLTPPVVHGRRNVVPLATDETNRFFRLKAFD
ncbi:MAG TPA: metallophosphoesterase [Methylomirabilota bacterium]|nr:metallophosphoesterase [Methylomirabilota bacterium]